MGGAVAGAGSRGLIYGLLLAAAAAAAQVTAGPPPGRTQADSVWGAALSKLKGGDRLRIRTEGQRIEGRLVAASGAMLTLSVSSGRSSYPTATIDSLWVRKTAAGRAALIVAIPGAAAGTLLGIVANNVGCADAGDPCPEAIPLLALGGAAAGALVGALIGSAIPRWQRRVP